MRRRLDYAALSADYASYHKHPLNRLCHAVGIPLIVFCVVRWTQIGSPVPWAAVVLPLYAFWSLRLALAMALILAAMAVAAPLAPAWSVWACFVLGWLLQFAGHRFFEKKSPAFLRNAIHLLVGPLWILSEATGLGR